MVEEGRPEILTDVAQHFTIRTSHLVPRTLISSEEPEDAKRAST